MKRDEEMEAAKKLDAYEEAEGLPQEFHAWGLLNARIAASAKRMNEERTLERAAEKIERMPKRAP